MRKLDPNRLMEFTSKDKSFSYKVVRTFVKDGNWMDELETNQPSLKFICVRSGYLDSLAKAEQLSIKPPSTTLARRNKILEDKVTTLSSEQAREQVVEHLEASRQLT